MKKGPEVLRGAVAGTPVHSCGPFLHCSNGRSNK